MRKFSYLFLGKLSKAHAGSRPLTDRERWSFIVMIYRSVAQMLFWQWKAAQNSELALNAGDKLLEEVELLEEENRHLQRKVNSLESQLQEYKEYRIRAGEFQARMRVQD